MRVLALIAIWLIFVTTGVGTAVFCYGSDHSQTESLFAGCCTRWYGSSQKSSSTGSSVQSKAILTQGPSSCGACVDVPLYLTQHEGVSTPEPSTGSTGVADHVGVVIGSNGWDLPDRSLQAAKKPDPTVASSPLSSFTVLRC